MAEPLTRPAGPGTIAVLEEAVQLLRQAPFSTLVCHAIGSVPFALGLLVFWNSLTTERLTDAACAIQAFALALLLLWMNCWRAVFAGHLRRQLDGTPGTPWTWSRAARLAAGQAFLGGTKLVILPLAALVGFPLAAATAFYRNATALADRDDLDPLPLISKARALAQVHPRQSWAILPVLAFLQVVVALNLALTFAMLPLLVRMLTGYESDFNRSGIFFLESPLFLAFVLVSTWMALDPFVQAVYCVRCFHGESVATGEDLRVALRRIRAAQVLAAMLLLAVLPVRAAEAVSPKELQQSAQHAMQAPEYAWRIPPPPATGIGGRPWVLRLADKVLDVLNSMWRAIGNAIGKLFEWLFGKLGKGPSPGDGTAPGAALHWSIYLLMAAVAAAAIWIAWRRRMFRRAATHTPGTAAASIRLDEDGVTADQLPEERWIEMALECLRQENYRLALRAFYLANLAWLGQRGFIAIHAGKTNREYELELRRKARQFAEARGLFGDNVSAFEAAWYGMHEVSGESVAEFRARLDGMKKAMA
jgi:uncharacterized protein DUF4129